MEDEQLHINNDDDPNQQVEVVDSDDMREQNCNMNNRLEEIDTDFDEEEEGYNDPDYEDALKLPKRRVKMRIEKCFICHAKVERRDLFRPCNCEFQYTHLQCLKRWMEEQRKCRICSQNYDILNAPNSCGICRENVTAAESIKPCDCKFRKHHRACVQKSVDDAFIQCLYCEKQYACVQTISWHLTSKNLQRVLSMCKFLLSIACKSIYFLFWFVISIFLAAPQNYIQLKWILLDCPKSVILFPGNDVFPLWLDIIFMIVTAISYVIALIIACGSFIEKEDVPYKGLWLLTPGILLFVLFHHLIGNIHYQIYCAASVIPSVNCYWMMNIHSLVAGSTMVYPPTILYLLFLCGRRICCKKIVTTTVLDLEKGAEN